MPLRPPRDTRLDDAKELAPTKSWDVEAAQGEDHNKNNDNNDETITSTTTTTTTTTTAAAAAAAAAKNDTAATTNTATTTTNNNNNGDNDNQRLRYVWDGFDLDLCYMTSRIIAMGFPGKGVEATARSPRAKAAGCRDERQV